MGTARYKLASVAFRTSLQLVLTDLHLFTQSLRCESLMRFDLVHHLKIILSKSPKSFNKSFNCHCSSSLISAIVHHFFDFFSEVKPAEQKPATQRIAGTFGPGARQGTIVPFMLDTDGAPMDPQNSGCSGQSCPGDGG